MDPGVIYRTLREEITDNLPGPAPSCSTSQFLNELLPFAETLNTAAELSKMTMGLELQVKVPKKAKPYRKKSGLSQKERRIVGLYRLPRLSISYAEALPMLRFWENYMFRYLKLDHMEDKQWYDPKSGNLWESMSVVLMKADYHGALLKVVNSKCRSLIGLQGIVIFDTKFTFTIVSEDNRSRTLPKQSCIFELYLRKYKLKIFGKNFCIRSNERSSKKIKSFLIPYF